MTSLTREFEKISDICVEQLGQTFSTLSAVITTVEGKTEESSCVTVVKKKKKKMFYTLIFYWGARGTNHCVT